MKICGVTGCPGSGKTELVRALVRLLAARGVRVSVLQHMDADFDVDRPGRDSHRHRQAGAEQVLLASRNRMALMRELRGAPAPSLDAMLAEMQPCDLVLVMGEDLNDLPRLACAGSGQGEASLAPGVLAVVSAEISATDLPVFRPDAHDAIADFILHEVDG